MSSVAAIRRSLPVIIYPTQSISQKFPPPTSKKLTFPRPGSRNDPRPTLRRVIHHTIHIIVRLALGVFTCVGFVVPRPGMGFER